MRTNKATPGAKHLLTPFYLICTMSLQAGLFVQFVPMRKLLRGRQKLAHTARKSTSGLHTTRLTPLGHSVPLGLRESSSLNVTAPSPMLATRDRESIWGGGLHAHTHARTCTHTARLFEHTRTQVHTHVRTPTQSPNTTSRRCPLPFPSRF